MRSRKERNKERLLHIAEAIDKINAYTGNMSYTSFLEDSKCNEAVLFHLSVIGEAIVHIDEEVLEQYPYPWHMVRAQRNVITHQYFGIRMDKIWSVIVNDLPELKEVTNEILNNEF